MPIVVPISNAIVKPMPNVTSFRLDIKTSIILSLNDIIRQQIYSILNNGK